jgi:hypothetical protein
MDINLASGGMLECQMPHPVRMHSSQSQTTGHHLVRICPLLTTAQWKSTWIMDAYTSTCMHDHQEYLIATNLVKRPHIGNWTFGEILQRLRNRDWRECYGLTKFNSQVWSLEKKIQMHNFTWWFTIASVVWSMRTSGKSRLLVWKACFSEANYSGHRSANK